jgi:WD40 repeat protein
MTEIALLNRNIEIKNVKLTSNLEEKDAEVMSVAFHKSVPYLASGFTNKKAKIFMYGKDLYNLNGHTGSVNSVAFHQKKLLIATGSSDKTVKIWIFEHHNRPRNNNNIKAIFTLRVPDEASINSVAFYPSDNQIILATGSSDGTANIFRITPSLSKVFLKSKLETHSREPIVYENFSDNIIFSVAFHPIHTILATGNNDNTVKLWYLWGDFTEKKMVVLSEHTGAVRTVSFSPNGLYLATGSNDNKVILWKVESESESANLYTILEGHTGAVRSISFCSFDSQDKSDKILILATGSNDKTVKLWKILTGSSPKKECLFTLKDNKGSVTSVAFFKNKFLATGSIDGTTKTYTLNFENIINNRGPLESRLIENRKNLIENRKNLIENRKNSDAFLRDNAVPLNVLKVESKYERNVFYFVITIPSKFFTPTKNSCPNFRDLYYSFMKTELPIEFIFKFEDQTGIDATGLSKMVFDAILKVYIELFFEKIKGNNDYLILKENINLRQLITDTKKLLFLVNAANSKICLKIDPELLDLCIGRSESNLKNYFNNEKQKFQDFYRFINETISNNSYNVLSSSNVFLKNNNKNENNIINRYKKLPNGNLEIKNMLKKEIRLRRFAAKCGFKSWKQLFSMNKFLDIFRFYPDSDFSEQNSELDRQLYQLFLKKRGEIFQKQENNPDIDIPDFWFFDDFFDFKPNFDIKVILSRVKIIRRERRKKDIEIDINNIPENLLHSYPALRPFIEYIMGHKSTDQNRKRFIQFITGTEYSVGEIKIFLIDSTVPFQQRKNGQIMFRLPFNNPSTCFSYIELFKRPDSGNYKNKLTEQRIDELILESILALTANNEVFNIQNNESSISSRNSQQENDDQNNRSSISSGNFYNHPRRRQDEYNDEYNQEQILNYLNLRLGELNSTRNLTTTNINSNINSNNGS